MKKRLSVYFYPFIVGLLVGSFVPHLRPTVHVPSWVGMSLVILPWVAVIVFWLWLKVKMGSDMSHGGAK